MIISHLKIIAFQLTITNHSFWTFYIGGKPVVYDISHSFTALTRETCSTLEINLVFLRTHVLFPI